MEVGNHSLLALGIDLGTTSVKVTLINNESHKVEYTVSEQSHAEVLSDVGSCGFEQSPGLIFAALQKCLLQIPQILTCNVCSIGISGQMHGLVLWKADDGCGYFDSQFVTKNASNLYTWQDQRCTPDFISALPKPDSHQHLATGFGCATLFWLAKHQPEILCRYDCAGSIMDFLVTILCGLDRPAMSSQISASWGYFNTTTRSWNSDILKEAGFPVHLLPWVVESGTEAGTLQFDWCGVPAGTPILAALGDLQCSILSCIKEENDAVLNISTSCQLAFPVQLQDFEPSRTDSAGPVSHFPYFNSRYLAVAASLNGGNVLTQFVKMLQQWFSYFGITIDENKVWEKLMNSDENLDETLRISPTLFGERHAPSKRGSVCGLTESNLNVDKIFVSLCHGLVDNLYQMMPCTFLMECNVKRVIATGSVVDKNKFVKDHIFHVYGKYIPVVQGKATDSALGASLAAIKFLKKT
ncbi:hypothetical protein ACJMK2_013043 [Sinanodonta woodiana]|uniref:Sedoheptulokinase n=1 Tax=Sinanodonta woodiana TaxID=1069815 RepID=A0ABD3VBY1_SINWO